MAAATFYSSRFASNGMPLGGVVQTAPHPGDYDWVHHTLAAEHFNEVNDKVVLLAVPALGHFYINELCLSWDRLDSNGTPTSAAKLRLEDLSQGAASFSPIDLVTLTAAQLGAAAAQPSYLCYPLNQVISKTRLSWAAITLLFTATPATATSNPGFRAKVEFKGR